MKYKVLTEFLPGVIVGQECEVKAEINHYLKVIIDNGYYVDISLNYAKRHPEIFQPIVELKENETEFEDEKGKDEYWGLWEKCKICKAIQPSVGRYFCSNCGRKRKS